MNKEICGEKLVKLKKKNSSTKNEPVKQEKRQKVSDKCQNMIGYLKSKQS